MRIFRTSKIAAAAVVLAFAGGGLAVAATAIRPWDYTVERTQESVDHGSLQQYVERQIFGDSRGTLTVTATPTQGCFDPKGKPKPCKPVK